MRILIDGYNLLHATDLFGTGADAGTLQGSREALLAFLASALSAGRRRGTTIVFDAAGAPPGLPPSLHHDHIHVRYAREYADADTLLEEIIDDHRAPRELMVVSADHRVQRAARRRGAKYIDSDAWYADLVRIGKAARIERGEIFRSSEAAGGSVAYWVKQFETSDLDTSDLDTPSRTPSRTPRHVAPVDGHVSNVPAPRPSVPKREPGREGQGDATADGRHVEQPDGDSSLGNPFPPGYAEDLLDD